MDFQEKIEQAVVRWSSGLRAFVTVVRWSLATVARWSSGPLAFVTVVRWSSEQLNHRMGSKPFVYKHFCDLDKKAEILDFRA